MANNSKLNKLSEATQKTMVNLINVKNHPYIAIGGVTLIILIIIIYVIVTMKNKIDDKKTKSPMVVGSPINAFPENPIIISGTELPVSNNGLEFSLNMWIYVSNWDWKFDQYKYIINRSITDDATLIGSEDAFCVKFDRTKNALISEIKTSYINNENEDNTLEKCIIKNIPIQKWINYCYVLNNRTANTYINGELVNSCALKGIPNVNSIYTSNLVLLKDNGYYGQFAKFQYFSEALSHDEINLIYKDGPYVSKSSETNFLDKEVNDQYDSYLKNLKENENGDFFKITGITRN